MKLLNIENSLKYVCNKDGSYTFIFVDTILNMIEKKQELNFYFLENKRNNNLILSQCIKHEIKR
jgi:hypothetical protein